jgi:RNA polymerase sigma-70 factor (ECF subfamily)
MVTEHSQGSLAGLLQAVALDQDRGAFADLFAHFAPRLKAYLRRLSARDEQLDDLVQEIMIIVWNRAVLYDPRKANVSTWVFTIARNKRIDAIRRERRPEIDPHDPAFFNDDPKSPDVVVAEDRQAAMIRAAVEQLPSEQGEVLRLSFFEDKPHTDIADTLGIPLGTVKSRLRLAMRRLRPLLEDHQ